MIRQLLLFFSYINGQASWRRFDIMLGDRDVDIEEDIPLCLELDTADKCFDFYNSYTASGGFNFFTVI